MAPGGGVRYGLVKMVFARRFRAAGCFLNSSGHSMGKKKRATKKSNGNEANLGFEATLWLAADKLLNNLDAAEYKHLVLANPPFNDSDWGGDKLQDDVRWSHGPPPKGNANFAWVHRDHRAVRESVGIRCDTQRTGTL